VKTARCHWKLRYIPKFTAASRGTPCDSVASCLLWYGALYSCFQSVDSIEVIIFYM